MTAAAFRPKVSFPLFHCDVMLSPWNIALSGDAVTPGTGKVAVDGVALIAEHGDYPGDEGGVKPDPRKERFDEILRVLDSESRRIPIFGGSADAFRGFRNDEICLSLPD